MELLLASAARTGTRLLSLIACHHRLGRAHDRLRVSHLSHGTSAMHALADPDDHLELAKRVGDLYCPHHPEIQPAAPGAL
jgi:hypothetical protein